MEMQVNKPNPTFLEDSYPLEQYSALAHNCLYSSTKR